MKKIYLLFCLSVLLISCRKSGNSVLVLSNGYRGYTTNNLTAKVDEVCDERPSMVVLMIGSNDVADLNIYPNFQNNLLKIVANIKKYNAKVLLLSPPPMSDSIHGIENLRLDTLCSIIKNVSEQQNCYYLDVNAIFKRYNNLDELLLADGLHPNANGYALLASSVKKYLDDYKIKFGNIICCFGDSITYGQYVKGEGTVTGETYPAVLSRLISNGQ